MGTRPLGSTVTPFRFSVNFSYYGLSLDLSGLRLNVYQTQLLFGAVELPSKLMVYLLVRRVGRRLTQAGTLLSTALTFGIRLLVSSGKPARDPASRTRSPALPQSSDSLPVWLSPVYSPSWEFLTFPTFHCRKPLSFRDEFLEHGPGGDRERFQ